ncbi:MAG: lectin-like protein [Bacteroidota bacterium]
MKRKTDLFTGLILLWLFVICSAAANANLPDLPLTGNITIHNCPNNIVVNAPAGSNGKTVSWNAPSASTTCVINSGQDCSSLSNNINGFIYMGEHNGSKYYCSNVNNYSWTSAKNKSNQNGGQLVVINNSSENNYVRSNLIASTAWIGYSDAANEGNWQWVAGSSNYTNWASGEPNNLGPSYNGADYALMFKNDGKWKDRKGSETHEFVMEKPCPPAQVPGNVSISQTQGPASGSFFPIGTTTIKFKATDDCGNIKICTFTVTVNATDPCAGQGGDSDNDGVCDNQDCQPNNPNFPATPGASCNDGNPNTENDVIQNDGCSCAGTPVANCGVTVTSDGCKITIANINDPGANIKIFNPGWSGVAFSCNPWQGNPCQNTEIIDGLPNGTYPVSVITNVCNDYFTVVINCATTDPCAGQGGDSDNDGVCDNQDCKPNNPNFPATPGTPCNDGNPNTQNDVVQGDGCSCAGTPVGPCVGQGGDSDNDGVCDNQDCQPNNPNFPAFPGTPCNDGNPNTNNDVVQSDGCSCAGTPTGGGGGGCTSVTNLALNKTATQSSTITAGGITGSASKAVDGNTNGVFFTGDNNTSSVSATQNEFQAFWQVDLGAEFNIEQVKIWNRTDGTDKTEDCFLIISSTPFGNADLNTALNQANFSKFESGPVGNPSVENIPAGTTGRYVRIQLQNTGYLVLAEVQVFGCASGGGGNNCTADAGTLSANQSNVSLSNGSAALSATPNGDQVIPAGFQLIYVLTKGANLTILGTNSQPYFTVNAPGQYKIHSLVFKPSTLDLGIVVPGQTTGFDVNNLLIQGGGSICASLLIDGAMFNVSGATDPCANAGGDSDNDGVCNNQDCKPFDPNFPATPGTPCNDGNPSTTNDVVQSDGCSCAGTPPASTCNVTVTTDGCKITISGLTDAVTNIKVFNPGYNGVAWSCNPWQGNPCSPTEMIEGLPNGVYPVSVVTSDANGVEICNFGKNIIISCTVDPCAGQGGDSDNDGVCNNQDCAPNNPNLPAPVGSSCNDGNPNTQNDVIQGDGCTCAGTPIPQTCSEKTLVKYDMDACKSFSSNGSNFDFSEFTPTFPNLGGCNNVTATNLSTDGAHSCVAGANNSTAGICILGEPGSSFKNNDDDALRFNVTVNPSGVGKLTKLTFFQLSPTHFAHLSGNTGTNNFLRKFGVRVTKNGNEIFKKTGRDVSQNGWEFESFSFEGIPAFEVTSTTTFKFEILGYKPIGNGSSAMFFDVDEIKVKGCCITNSNFAVPNMLDFKAKKEGRHSAISWLMTKDTDVDYYDVEVSTDEVNFEKVGEVVADQVDSPRAYDLMDYDPSHGENFYRLKVVNMDGSFFYSNVRRLQFDIDFEEVVVYPNPTNNHINITLNDFSGKAGTIEIFNQLGQQQFGRDYLSIPTIPVNVDVSKFVPGIYTISIKIDNHRRFAKQFVVTDR